MAELSDWFRARWTVVVAAIVAYGPIVASSPGQVGADTKTYLYLDPGRVLAEATTLWDADVALGTVTHQNIGYLWPMGPFYWVLDALGSPDWFAQRLWLGTLLFAAGTGVRYLLRTLHWEGGGLLVAMLAYELSPYLLDYSARISAVLLPWAGLPWMIALTIRSARSGGWRHPALFALLTVTIGSVNATSLLLVGIAPVLWLAHAVWVERSLAFARALLVTIRIGALTLGVSLWWIAGLALQGGYSLPVTRYTETYQTVASASTAPEVLRGLGYWFFYGNDKFGQWIEPSIEYTQGVWLLFVSYGLAVLALLGAAVVRWRHRGYFVLLVVVGGLLAVGSHPFDAPSPLGSLFKDFTTTDAGLALRSTPRALPMLVLATAVLLGALVNGLERRFEGWARPFTALVLVAVVLNNPAMWRVRMIEEHLRRDEDIPEYWLEAIDALDDSGRTGRVMELPGSDFASYRWGNTVDPITPGFLERGYVARELVPFGSPESAALLTAFDRRFQEDTVDPGSIVPIARLLSVDDVVHRADLTYERFRTPRPVPTADLLDTRAGLGPSVGFGPATPNVAGPEQTLLDEVWLAIDPGLPDPAPVTAYQVPDALDEVRLRPLTGAVVIVGDAEGVVDAAGAGLLDVDRPIWFGADLARDQTRRDQVLTEPAAIIITDSNRRRAKRWGTLRENVGHVERADEVPLLDDPTDSRLELFAPDSADPDLQTVSRQPGPFALRASNYGNPVTYTNDDRPAQAIDGDPDTAWVVGAFAEARGEWLEFTYDEPTTVREITLVQPRSEANRHVTEVEIRADGRALGRVALGADSLTVQGQRVELPAHDPATVYEIELTDLDLGVQPTYPGVSPVGFAEVRMGPDAVPVVESLRTPVALMDSLGATVDRHDLSVVLTRERSNPQEPVRGDPEAEIRRDVVVPVGRTWTVEGTARLSAAVEESAVDALIGRAVTRSGAPAAARSSGRLPGDLRSGASFAFDGDVATAWTGEFGPQAGQWIEYTSAGAIAVEELVLDVVVDDAHSVPTELEVIVDGTSLGRFDTGLALADAARGSTQRLALGVPLDGETVRVVFTAVDERATREWYSNTFTAMPVSLAEVAVGDGAGFAPPTPVNTGCIPVLEIDGTPVGARVTGTAEAALARHGLALAGCDTAATEGGEFIVQTAARTHGLDLDQVVLRSPRPLAPAAVVPEVVVVERDDTHMLLSVPARDEAMWLVLGQSHNDGWEATVEGDALAEPELIDAFANGWLLAPGEEVIVALDWRPQELVGRALWASALAVIVVLFLAGIGRSDERSLTPARADGGHDPTLVPIPFLDRPGPGGRPSAGVRPAVVAGTVAAGFAVLNLPRWPALALVVGALTALAVWWPAFWTRPALWAALSLGVAALSIMVDQWRFRFPPGFGWPQQFADVHVLGVLCLLLLFADYLVTLARPRRRVD